MKYNYTVLFEKGNYALIERGEKHLEYAVVASLKPESERKYEGSDWGWTCGYTEHTPQGLSVMLDFFRLKTETNYISRSRLEELANLFKDAAAAYYDRDATDEELEEEIEELFDLMGLEDYEKEFFRCKANN